MSRVEMARKEFHGVKKHQLRSIARIALCEGGKRVESVLGRGLMPDSRFKVFETNQEPQIVAVRVSLDREIGLTLDRNRDFVTLPNVDQVVAVVPAADGSDAAEVLSLDPAVLIRAGEYALQRKTSRKSDIRYKVPIFISVDDPEATGAGLTLRQLAQWSKLIPLDQARAVARGPGSVGELLERTRSELALRLGLDPGEVSLNVEIKPGTKKET
jgi:hypothetical protein